jgi:putative transposase
MTRNCHVPFCRAVGEATLLLTLIILAAGLAVSVCGASVRPEESKSRKATAKKQKPKS